MKKALTYLAVAVCSTILINGTLWGSYALAKNTDNDIVLKEKDYTEIFKNEGHDKNYLYTRTEIPAPKPGKCIVVTGDSEQTIALFCNTDKS